jgi:hypothetical protein
MAQRALSTVIYNLAGNLRKKEKERMRDKENREMPIDSE